MSAESQRFIDTNVFVYLLSSDAGRSDTAENVVEGGGVISVQVLNELTNVARRKLSLSWEDVHDLTSTIRTICTVSPMTDETYDLGVHLAERYVLSVYDAMIVASALENNCHELLSEDMHNGLVIENSLTIRNPFIT